VRLQRKYGWLTDLRGGWQQNGFFIDSTNRILFWPRKKSPGYVVDEDTAGEIIAAQHKSTNLGYFTIIPLLLIWPFSQWISQMLYADVSAYFSRYGLLATVVGALVAGISIALLIFDRLFFAPKRGRALQELLINSPQVHERRPAAEYLKPSEANNAGPIRYWLTVLFILATSVGLLLWALPPVALIGDQAVRALSGLISLLFVVFLIWRQLTSLRKQDVHFYQFSPKKTEDDVTDEPEAAPEDTSKVNSVLKFGVWLISGWRMWVLALPASIAVVIGTLKLMEEPITHDQLVTRFMDSAYGKSPSPDRTFLVQKWDRDVTAFITPNAGQLANKTHKTLERFSFDTGLKISFTEDPQHTADIILHFREGGGPMAFKDSPQQIWTAGGHQDRGRIRLYLSDFDLEKHLNELNYGYFGNSKALGKLNDRVAEQIAQAAWGLHGNYSEGPKDKTDRSGERIWFPRTLIAMYYDHRILPGASHSELRAMADVLAREILAAPSFQDWLKNRNHDPGHRAVYEGRYDQALKLFMNNGDLGDAVTQYRVGWLHEMGQGSKQDFVEAVKWYRKAAEQEYGLAQNALGRLFMTGKAGNKDRTQAIALYERAAAQDISIAQSNLCAIYYKGIGVPKDFNKAYDYCVAAAQYGHGAAQDYLGLYHLKGINVEQSDAEACKWFGYAAAQKHPIGTYHLGECHRTGRGLEKDEAKAIELYKTAAAMKVKAATIRLKNLSPTKQGDKL